MHSAGSDDDWWFFVQLDLTVSPCVRNDWTRRKIGLVSKLVNDIIQGLCCFILLQTFTFTHLLVFFSFYKLHINLLFSV